MVACTTPPPRRIVARSWDRLAHDLLGRGLEWTVHSVFAQACNLVAADGTLLASGAIDGRVRLRELKSGRTIASIQAHTGAAYGVADASLRWPGAVRSGVGMKFCPSRSF